MKYKTLFRLGQKLVALLIIGQSAGSFVSVLASMTLWYRGQNATAGWIVQDWYPSILQPTVELAVGVYLFLGGRWIADMAIPSNRPYCHECGYDLTGADGSVCAECGTAFRSEVGRAS